MRSPLPAFTLSDPFTKIHKKRAILFKGFTFIELVAVIAVLGAIIAIAFPRLAYLDQTNLKTDAGRVCSLIRYTSDASETKRLHYRLLFDLEEGTIVVESSRDGVNFSAETDPAVRRLSLRKGIAFEDMVVQGLGKLDRGRVSVVFTPSGVTQDFVLHMRAENEAYTISFNMHSGKPSIAKGYV